MHWIQFELLILFVIVGLILFSIGMLIVAYVRSRRIGELARRLERVETRLENLLLQLQGPQASIGLEVPADAPSSAAVVHDIAKAGKTTSWELFIGQKALGWIATIVLLFATAFFLRYAFENNWVGPVGRVGVGVLGGTILVCGGWHYHRRGWRVFSQMLTSGGVMLLYLASYSATAFYQLIPQWQAAGFLLAIIVQSALLALAYDAAILALMSLAGGLITPLLMHSDQDQYVSLFTYLVLLATGVVLLGLRKHWPAVSSLALLGTQGLFWLWYSDNYHPEKLSWAIGFQSAVFVLFLGHSLASLLLRDSRPGWQDLSRMIMNGFLWFAAAYVLLDEDYGLWMGTLAVSLAAVYAAVGRLHLTYPGRDQRLLFAALAVAAGFIALAFPIQADTQWIALGWAAEAAALWWFGLRVQSPVLRAMAAVLALLGTGKVVFADTPAHLATREPLEPLFNTYAAPALGVAACLLGALAGTRQFVTRLIRSERVLVAIAGVAGVLLVWMVLSVDVYTFFDVQASIDGAGRSLWLWRGQVSMSALWTVYSTMVLALGFRIRIPMLRWTALGLYGLTIAKVFVFDTAELDEVYRILAFFILAIFLGGAAWAYQRMQPDLPDLKEGGS